MSSAVARRRSLAFEPRRAVTINNNTARIVRFARSHSAAHRRARTANFHNILATQGVRIAARARRIAGPREAVAAETPAAVGVRQESEASVRVNEVISFAASTVTDSLP